MKTALLLFFLSIVTAGCSSVKVSDYSKEKPKFFIEEYFNGPIVAHGFFQDRSGQVVKRFKVTMKGTWKNDTGTLEEDFDYSDGTKSRRVWTITKDGKGGYTGKADDVIGEANGEAAGNAFRWKYTLSLAVGKKTYHVQIDDWMYLMNDGIVLNKSKMTKLGFDVGEITLVFFKEKK